MDKRRGLREAHHLGARTFASGSDDAAGRRLERKPIREAGRAAAEGRMDPMIFLGVAVVAVVVVSLAVGFMRRRPEAAAELPPAGGTRRGLDKVMFLIDHCRDTLDAAKLKRGNDKYTHYYVGYLYEVARGVAEDEAVAFSTAFQTPVLLEAIRLCGGDGLARGQRLIPSILSSAPARRGAEDGKADAAETVDAKHRGPYWSRIHDYFEAARSEA
jgi:hypothetical protein